MNSERPRINATKLWVGGVMTGLVAAGVALVGLMIARGIFDIPVLIPDRAGDLVNSNSWWYALVAFGAALAATALLHVLLLAAPQPRRFFNWIVGLGIALAVLAPFGTEANLKPKIATAAINLAIGVSVVSLVGSVGRSAVASPPASRYGTIR